MKKEKVARGVALLVSLIFAVVLGIGAVAVARLHSTEISLVRRQNNSTRAFYIAEGGFERARYDLGQDDDWTGDDINGYDKGAVDSDGFYLLEYGDATKTSLGEDTEFTVWLKDTDEPAEMIWIKSEGVYPKGDQNEAKRVVKAMMRLRKLAIVAGGTVDVRGSAVVNGDILENKDISFVNVFGVDIATMKGFAQINYPDTYYDTSFNSDPANGITYIESGVNNPNITPDGWIGSGLLIVEGDLMIAGGTFDGVIWVVGTLHISGKPAINGSIFVGGGATIETTVVTGNPTITFVSQPINITGVSYTLASLRSVIELWQEE